MIIRFRRKYIIEITVAIGSVRELMPSEILYIDSTDYLLGGALTLKNGRIDMYQFDEGYCQATQYNATQDNFTFLYYDRDTKPIKIVSGSIIGNKYSWNHSTACCISGISRLTLNEPPSTVLFHSPNILNADNQSVMY